MELLLIRCDHYHHMKKMSASVPRIQTCAERNLKDRLLVQQNQKLSSSLPLPQLRTGKNEDVAKKWLVEYLKYGSIVLL